MIATEEPWALVPVLPARQMQSLESDPYVQAGTTDADISMFRRITSTQKPDSLSPATFRRYQGLSAWLYYQNPLARHICQGRTSMCLGGGFNIDTQRDDQSSETNVRELLDRFLDNPINSLQIRFPEYFTQLASVLGELFLPIFVQPQSGDVSIGYLEPSLVVDVLFEPGNRSQARSVIQRSAVPGEKPYLWRVIQAEMTPDGAMFPPHPAIGGSVTRQVGAQDPGIPEWSPLSTEEASKYQYAGEILYFTANKFGTGRGRSLLEPVLDWLHVYDSFLFSDVRNANLQSAFVWDITLAGADGPSLKKRTAEIQMNPPTPGCTRVHNDKEKWEAVTPRITGAANSDLGAQVKRVIGMGVGLPSHMIGAEDGTNRTTANSTDTPFIREMEQCQNLGYHLLRTLCDYQLDQKKHMGLLQGVVSRPYPYRVVLPPVTLGAVVALAEALFNITNSLIEAKNEGITSLADSQRIWYAYGLQESGAPETLNDQIRSERAAGMLIDPVELAMAAPAFSAANPDSSSGGARVIRAKSTVKAAPTSRQRGK